LFSFALVGLGLWGLFIFAMRSSPDVERALFWDRMAIPAGMAMFVFYYHFAAVYTRRTNRRLLWAAYSFLAATGVLFASGLVISHMSLEVYGYAPHFDSIMYAITAGGTLCLVGALLNLKRALHAATHHEYRTRLTYMIIAIILLFSFGILDLIPELPPFGIFGNIIFGVLTTVAVLKYHLLDINIALRRGLAYFLMSAIVAVPYVLVVYVHEQILIRPVPIGVLLALLAVTAVTLNRMWRPVERFVERQFHRQRYDFIRAAEQFSREAHDITDLKSLGSRLVKLINPALQSSSIYLLVRSESGDFTTISTSAENVAQYTLKSDSPILGSLRSNKALLYCQDKHFVSHYHLLAKQEREALEDLGAELFVPLKDKNGELVGLLLLGKKLSRQPYSYEDEQLVLAVTSRIAVEVENARLYEQVRYSERQLRHSETLFRTIVEAGPGFLMIVDAKGTVIYASPNCEQFTGYTQEELHGKAIWWVHENDLVRIREAFNTALHEEVSEGRNIEFTAVRKNGETWCALASWQLLKDWKEHGKAVVVQVTDITARKQAEERERQLQEQLNLSSRLASIGELAAGVAHEINNPLTGILGFSHRLLRKCADEKVRQDLEGIYGAAARAAKVVRNLLTFARHCEPEKQYTDVNDVVRKTLELRAYELKTSNIEVVTELAADLPKTMVDFHQIQEVFLNIVLNAEQAMTEANRGGKLRIKSEETNGCIRISFADNGPGIPIELLDKVFDPFFSLRRERGGTGLGLSVSHGIVISHGGRIYAKSRLGKGATFFVELPVTAKNTNEAKFVR
jgi:PAS domain S-box-containing protein